MIAMGQPNVIHNHVLQFHFTIYLDPGRENYGEMGWRELKKAMCDHAIGFTRWYRYEPTGYPMFDIVVGKHWLTVTYSQEVKEI